MILIDEYSKNILRLIVISPKLKTIDKSINIEEIKSLYSRIKSAKNKFTESEELKFNHPMKMYFYYNKFQFELNFDIVVKVKGDKVLSNQFLLQIFSLNEELSFREDLDTENIKNELEKIGWRRLMLQLHFDKHPHKDKFHPTFHVQIGGNNSEQHLWHPELLNIPRIPNFPMELILFFEFILMNFYKDNNQAMEFLIDDAWKNVRKISEKQIIQPFLQSCLEYFQSSVEEKTEISFLMSL
ncbi:MAG: hypothetical protein HeimC2_34160 [Candidatus Heimdallarchaeota archaeon LC_2]|nr:MAG: hypothetical protein HeimC2_34160 [Candidatus Heimdallarchaeota archaeon LC_2]